MTQEADRPISRISLVPQRNAGELPPVNGGNGRGDGVADWSAEALLSTEFAPPVHWLGPFVFEACRAMLSGATGIGKTRWLLGCAKAILAGESFATLLPDPSALPPPILYLDYELGVLGMKDILTPMQPLPPGLHVVCFDDPRLGEDGFHPLDREEGQKQVLRLISGTRARLAIIDNLYSSCVDGLLGGSETTSAHKNLSPFLKLLSRNGVASLCAHHAGNDATRAYGDSRLTWASTGHLHIEGREHPRDGEFRVQVRSLKLRYGKALPRTEMVCDVSTGGWTVVGERCNRPLTESQKWLRDAVVFNAAEASPHPIEPLRAAYHERYSRHLTDSTARSNWKRDREAVMGCVANLRFSSTCFWIEK